MSDFCLTATIDIAGGTRLCLRRNTSAVPITPCPGRVYHTPLYGLLVVFAEACNFDLS